jgi:hypothetical protein
VWWVQATAEDRAMVGLAMYRKLRRGVAMG